MKRLKDLYVKLIILLMHDVDYKIRTTRSDVKGFISLISAIAVLIRTSHHAAAMILINDMIFLYENIELFCTLSDRGI